MKEGEKREKTGTKQGGKVGLFWNKYSLIREAFGLLKEEKKRGIKRLLKAVYEHKY
jgi:hypothetical protein